jgi:hypothetical protein
MKSVLVISPTDLKRDPRVYRQLKCLVSRYSVTAIGLASPEIDNLKFFPIQIKSKNIKGKLRSLVNIISRNFENYYWASSFVTESLSAVADNNYDVIIANDVISLPLAIRIGGNYSKIILDAHEYSPLEYEENLLWRILWSPYFDHICKLYLKKVSGMMTVCEGLATEYSKNYNVVKPLIVYNAPPYQILEPSPISDNKIRIVHHGASIKGRRLETLIEMMGYLDSRYTLDFYLMPDGNGYLKYLINLARNDTRIKFNNPVSMQKLPKICNEYDVGVYSLAPANFNNLNALPNKIFEFIQARLALAIGPSPEMCQIVNDYNCGVVAKDFSAKSLAKAILGMSDQDIMRYKNNTNEAARALCAENAIETIFKLVG